jgi:Na+-transporting NADH:ubiquinone oxidoreductase subunit NqrD
MNEANVTVMKRAVFLWIGAGLVLGLNVFAAYQQSAAVIYAALAITGLFALVGIGFGIWAARTITRAAATPR